MYRFQNDKWRLLVYVANSFWHLATITLNYKCTVNLFDCAWLILKWVVKWSSHFHTNYSNRTYYVWFSCTDYAKQVQAPGYRVLTISNVTHRMVEILTSSLIGLVYPFPMIHNFGTTCFQCQSSKAGTLSFMSRIGCTRQSIVYRHYKCVCNFILYHILPLFTRKRHFRKIMVNRDGSCCSKTWFNHSVSI